MANIRGTNTLVVCVSMKSGEIVWSRGVDGIYWMAVDPATDNLFVVDDSVFEFSEAAGEIVQQHLFNEKEEHTERVSIENFRGIEASQ